MNNNAPITQLPPELLAAKQKADAAWDYHQELVVGIFQDLDFDITERAAAILEAAGTARKLEAVYNQLYAEYFHTERE